jgi:hypothetical protein
MDTAERVIVTLRAHEAELRQAGLRSLSLFGSVARGEGSRSKARSFLSARSRCLAAVASEVEGYVLFPKK